MSFLQLPRSTDALWGRGDPQRDRQPEREREQGEPGDARRALLPLRLDFVAGLLSRYTVRVGLRPALMSARDDMVFVRTLT